MISTFFLILAASALVQGLDDQEEKNESIMDNMDFQVNCFLKH